VERVAEATLRNVTMDQRRILIVASGRPAYVLAARPAIPPSGCGCVLRSSGGQSALALDRCRGGEEGDGETVSVKSVPGAEAAAPRLRPASALRQVLAEGYRSRDLAADALAGLTVGLVALPLSMALAIASGVAPQYGLYTAIVGGLAIGLLGGSRVQVSGPTAAFVAVLAPIAARYGIGGLLLATVMAGALQVLMGVSRLGKLVQYIPYPVTTGFTAGIAVVIATTQIRDLLGLTVGPPPAHFLERLAALVAALPSARYGDAAIGALTLAVLLLWPRVSHRIPSPLVALAVAGAAAAALSHLVPGFAAATIGSTFSFDDGGVLRPGIPRLPPLPVVPWSLPGADGRPLELSLGLLRELAPPAIAIAALGAIESLLSAVVADGMTGTRHDPDAELVAQGTGNLLAPFFGGIAATGAIARTATNVRSGARSPLAAAFHALTVLAAVLLLAPLLSYLPMASLAALLLVVAWNMAEVGHVLHAVRVAPRSDTLVLATCFGLTVLFDMVVAVGTGVVLAALLFMRRMAEVSGARLVTGAASPAVHGLPRGALLYEVAGPLFFGAAHKAVGALHTVEKHVRVVILDMRAVPVMDATGLVNLESAMSRLWRDGTLVILAGVQRQPLRLMARAGWRRDRSRLAAYKSIDQAVARARVHLAVEGGPA